MNTRSDEKKGRANVDQYFKNVLIKPKALFMGITGIFIIVIIFSSGMYIAHKKTKFYYRILSAKRNAGGFLNGSLDFIDIFNDKKFFTSTYELASMLLAPDEKIDSRAFASIIKDNSEFHIFYAGRDAITKQWSIFRRSSPTLHGIKSANEHLVIHPDDINVKMVWMPYILKDKSQYHLFFTARKQTVNEYGNFDEFVMKTTSDNLLEFNTEPTPVLKAELPWEGKEVENWGIINISNKYYMSYESRGPSQKQEQRSIGYAVSPDLDNWERMQDEPYITGGVCCSSFFKVGGSHYSLAANGPRLAIHSHSTFAGLSDKNLLGYIYPHGIDYKGIVDTPEIVTDSITKSFTDANDEIILCFSSTDSSGNWITQYIVYSDINGFIKSAKLN